MPETRKWWIIDVQGYGALAVYGTEMEAESTRAAKAEWEGSTGTKRLAVFTDKIDVRMVEDQQDEWRDDHEGGVELEPNQREAIGV